jgi:plastocyanin
MKYKNIKSLVIMVFVILAPMGVLGEVQRTHEVLVLQDTFRFSPEVVHIAAGDTVKWVNHDTRKHQFASVPGSGPTDALEFLCDEVNPEQACDHIFKSSGEYPYFCFIHQQMLGLVVVGN